MNVYNVIKPEAELLSEQNRKKTSALNEVVSSLVPLRFRPNESGFCAKEGQPPA